MKKLKVATYRKMLLCTAVEHEKNHRKTMMSKNEAKEDFKVMRKTTQQKLFR